MASNLARQWFQPGEGIAREVITADIQRYLGPDALVRPGTGIEEFEGVDGYWITAYRTLTTQMVADLRMDSQRWRAEGQQGRGSPYSQGPKLTTQPDKVLVAYQDSRTHQSRQYYGPSAPQPAIERQRVYTQTQSDTPGYAEPGYQDLPSNNSRTQPSQTQDREAPYGSYRQPPAGYIVQGDHYVLAPRGYPPQGLPQGVQQQRPMDPVYADPRFPQPARGEDPRNQRDPRDTRDTRDPRDLRDPRDTRDPRSMRDPRDARDPRDSRYQREQDMRGGYQYPPQPSTAQATRNGDPRYMPGSQPSAPTTQYDQYGQPYAQNSSGGIEYPPQPRDPQFRDPRGQAPPTGPPRRRGDGGGDRRERGER
ncbi:hypothetical protein B0A49_12381 [Cryomyces minteri]|uniref:Uncharacterized protein n=1 Tax=Cryomyces minteri TaxID=331657 RepID=A0A4U0VXB8_9PEZI|nr:hypothetical protein B0A49_12381 [Cryomyces minteri]